MTFKWINKSSVPFSECDSKLYPLLLNMPMHRSLLGDAINTFYIVVFTQKIEFTKKERKSIKAITELKLEGNVFVFSF